MHFQNFKTHRTKRDEWRPCREDTNREARSRGRRNRRQERQSGRKVKDREREEEKWESRNMYEET